MRDTTRLHPELRRLIPELTTACKKEGLLIGIGECLRTAAEQDALYAQGRTKPGRVVTNARGSALQSQHQWGIAFDFYRNDGTGAFNDTDGFFYKVGAVAKRLGLAWGGDWRDIKDKPHLYLPKYSPDGTTAWLKNTYGTPERFFTTWEKAATVVRSDTTCDITVRRGGFYTAQFTGADEITVTAGTGGVVTIVPIKRGAATLAAIVPIGRPGDAAGIYTQTGNEKPVKQFVARIGG